MGVLNCHISFLECTVPQIKQMLVMIFFTQAWELYGTRILIQRLSCQKCLSVWIGVWKVRNTQTPSPKLGPERSHPSQEVNTRKKHPSVCSYLPENQHIISPLRRATFELDAFSRAFPFSVGYMVSSFPSTRGGLMVKMSSLARWTLQTLAQGGNRTV